jgi:hypothetical protein
MFFGLAPMLFDLQHPYSTAAWVLAGGYLLITLLTDTPLGLIRVIPFKVHGAMELMSGIAFLAIPFIFGFHDEAPNARNFFIISGVMALGAWLITDWQGHTRTMLTDAGERRH